MKKFLSLALLSFFVLPLVAKADIAPDPGYHRVSGCAFFDNLSDFPTYDVYETLYWRFGPSATPATPSSNIDALLTGEYGCSNDSGNPFFAIKQSNQKNIVHKSDDERGDWWDTLSENKQYFINATVTGTGTDYSSELVNGDMPDSNPTVTFVSVYHIDSLTDTTFTAHLSSEAQYDKNGKALTKTTNQTTPVGTTSTRDAYIVLGAIMAIGIGLLTLTWKTLSKK